jgi:hypothetical protein
MIKITPLTEERGVKVVLPEDTAVTYYDKKVGLVDFYKHQLDAILESVGTTETKKYILAFIKVYGSDYKRHVLESRISTSRDSINNYESALRREGLLEGRWPDALINPQIKFNESPLVIITYLTPDEGTLNVNHRNYKK